MRAMAAPTVGHLDPLMVAMLDDVRAKLTRLFRAPDGSFAFAVSGTGTSGMRRPLPTSSSRVPRTVVVTGYFGDRLARMCERYRATVTRVNGSGAEQRIRRRWRVAGVDTRRRRGDGPRRDVDGRPQSRAQAGGHRAQARRAHDRRRGHVVWRRGTRVGAWGIDVCYSCTQNASARRPVSRRSFAPRALDRLVKCPSFYFSERLLAQSEVSPHDVVGAAVRALRSADDDRGKASTRAGRSTSATIARSSKVSQQSASRFFRRKASASTR
jgi:alanine-glyoxylate transaminase/serine-glyoxylate transaminase/serine-pyruvate transaminase